MNEDQNKPDPLEATARDYLGQPSPLAFKNQPALPSGGGSIGVGAGPNTTAAGKGAGAVKQDAAFNELLTSLGYDPTGGGDASGAAGGGNAGAASVSGPESGVSGFDATTAGIGLNVASAALGVPGAVALGGGLLGAPGLATGVPGAAKGAFSLGSLANSIANSISPQSNMTMNTAEGPISVAPTYTGLFSALANALTGQSNFASVDPSTGQITTSPYGGQSAIGSSLAALSGPTGGLGQAGMHGPQGGFNPSAPGAPGSPSGAYGGYGGVSGDPSAPGAVGFGGIGQGRGDSPPADAPGTGGASGDKVVCTAMNAAYGFGAFRNAVWLTYARTHLTPAHQRGYHWWGKPMVRYAYGADTLPRRCTRAVMEHVARHRTADLWREMRGGKRDPLGRAYRAILEPLCFAIGKLA